MTKGHLTALTVTPRSNKSKIIEKMHFFEVTFSPLDGAKSNFRQSRIPYGDIHALQCNIPLGDM